MQSDRGPRPPFQTVQRIGHMGLTGFSSPETYVLDWDGEWWMWTWRWDRLKVNERKLLGPVQ